MKKIIITPADKFEIDFVVDYVLKCNFHFVNGAGDGIFGVAFEPVKRS